MKKEKLEIVYSVGVILAIPAVLVLNTVLLVQSTRNAFNTELRRKADLVNSVIAAGSASDVQAKKFKDLSAKLDQVRMTQTALSDVRVLQEQSGDLVQVAGTKNAVKEVDTGTELQAKIAYDRKLSVAKLINVSTEDGTRAQAWNVATPIIDESKKVHGVVITNVLTTDAEEAIGKAFQTSFYVLIASIVFILALLFRHFRLVGNIHLLAKEREINQTMGDFLSVATHELKAPTTIIKGYIYNVLDGTFGPVSKEITEQLQVAVDQTDRLNALVKDLLDVSRIEQGRIEYNMQAVDSKKIIEMIVNNYHVVADSKGLQLKLEVPETIPTVHGDEGRIQEVFTNLVDNALKYTAKGAVVVTMEVQKDKVVTKFKDSGFGMSNEARQRLFQRFYRIKTENTKDISGTGLGLWIIKQYVTAMGGTIDVESMEGVGSEFIVTLPISK